MDVVEVVFIFVVIIVVVVVVVDVAIEVVVVTVDVDSATVTEKTTLESVECSVLLEVRTSELVEEDADDEAVDAVMGEVEVIFLFGPELEDITVIVVVVVVVVGVTVGVVVAVVVIVVIIVVVLDVVVNSVTCSSDTGSEKEFIIPKSLLHKD